VSVSGKIRRQETAEGSVTVSFTAERLEILDIEAARAAGGHMPVVLSIREEKITADVTRELRRILQAHPGGAPVHMHVIQPGNPQPVRMRLPGFAVDPGRGFMADVKSLLGPTSVAM
jgi:DNA polymerase-3 subunit alpha